MSHTLPPSAVTKIVEVLAHEPQVVRVTLYGSRAKGCAKPGSDIDLVVTAPQADRPLLLLLDQRLDDLLLPWNIDLNFLHLIQQQDLLDHIARVGIVWYDRHAPLLVAGREPPSATPGPPRP